MTQYTISCKLHDYIEIACLYGYRINLKLKDGGVIEGKAIDVRTSPEKFEYLIIENDQQQVELSQIKTMTSLTPNSKFKNVNF